MVDNSYPLDQPRPAPMITRTTHQTQTVTHRRIRCKMCRQELATRENILDHDQFGPSAKGYVPPRPPAAARPTEQEDDASFQFINHVDVTGEQNAAVVASPADRLSTSPPISDEPPMITSSECSGYFVQPMRWMDHFLNDGQTAGRIRCPNTKCGAKIGCYDWAGICCACHIGGKWVTPGFCINRSKVDEILR